MLKPNIGRDVGRSETSACTGGSVKDTTSGVSNLFSLKQQERKMENINPWGWLGKLWQYAYTGMPSIWYNEPNRRINVDIFGKTHVKQKKRFKRLLYLKRNRRDFPRIPVAKTSSFYYMGLRFNFDQGNKIPHATWRGQNNLNKAWKEKRTRNTK